MTNEQINKLTISKAHELLDAYDAGEFTSAQDAILEGIKVGLELGRIAGTDDEQFMKDQMFNSQEII